MRLFAAGLRATGGDLQSTPDLSVTDYARELQDEQKRLRLTDRINNLSVEASFNLSYARLDGDTARVFRTLAVFPASFDAAATESVCETKGHARLSELARRNLVLYDAASERYRLHDLVRDFANGKLKDSERDSAELRHAEHYLGVLRAADHLYKEGRGSLMLGLALFDREWVNIQAGQARSVRRMEAAKSGKDEAGAAKLVSDYPDAGRYCLVLRLHPREQIGWREAALDAARSLEDRAAEGRHLGNLGVAYQNLGEYRKAIGFHEQHLASAREIGNRQGEGIALWNRALVLRKVGRKAEAIADAEAALQIYEQIESPHAARVRDGLAKWRAES